VSVRLRLSAVSHSHFNSIAHGTKTETGVLKFAAPNWKLKELPEIAIVHLGKLSISDTYLLNQTALQKIK